MNFIRKLFDRISSYAKLGDEFRVQRDFKGRQIDYASSLFFRPQLRRQIEGNGHGQYRTYRARPRESS